ncbi:ribbon-helix-helix domain-containing protein [bacterium]|nr:ribbon-helix-helix domain-containing protein [bacterium]
MAELLSEYIATKLTKSDAVRLAKLAEQEDRSISWLVRKAIRDHLTANLKS